MTNANNHKDDRSYIEDNPIFSVDFDYDAVEKATSMESITIEPAPQNLQIDFSRIIAEALQLVDSMTEEERKVLIGRTFHGKSFRKIGKEIGRDKKTVQSRLADATLKLKNSPLFNPDFLQEEYQEPA